jgi:hypothetical protein
MAAEVGAIERRKLFFFEKKNQKTFTRWKALWSSFGPVAKPGA